MSHSRVFDEFAKIMLQRGLLKTADKKDLDYNIVSNKDESDIKTDKTGYELTEIAHPEQIQVAESRLNDGIVENSVECQKIMVDVALRNPRGILASLMTTLVKAASILDAEMSNESIKMASEIDIVIEKLAQQKRVVANFADLLVATTAASAAFQDQKFTTFGMFESTEAKKNLEAAGSRLRNYVRQARQVVSDDEKLALGQEITSFVIENNKKISEAIDDIRSKVMLWGTDPKQVATDAWSDLYEQSQTWNTMKPTAPTTQISPVPSPTTTVIPKVVPIPADTEQKTHNVQSKTPSAHYSVRSPEVKELQELLNVDPDTKFGPITFKALMQKATTNNLLNDLLRGKPELAGGYQNWKNSDIGLAIQRIQQGKASTEKVQTQGVTGPEILDPYKSK